MMSQQPQYQQGPPPGWAPPPVQSQHQGVAGPPPGWQPPPAAQPQYQSGAPAAGGADPWDVPDERPAAGDQPSVPQLAMSSRLVIVKPRRLNPNGHEFQKPDVPQKQMFVDLIVLDGPPIAGYEDFITKVVTPFAMGPKTAPFFMKDVMFNRALFDRCQAALANGSPVLGRLSSNPSKKGGFPWWNLDKPTEADNVLCRQVYPRWDELEAAATAMPAGAPNQWGSPVEQVAQAQSQPGWGTPPPAAPPQWQANPTPQYQGQPGTYQGQPPY